MSYSKETVDEGKEQEEKNITWQIVSPDQLRQLIADTLDEEILQNVQAISLGHRLLPKQDSNAQGQTLQKLDGLIETLTSQLTSLQSILRNNPNQPLPIDHRYEKSGGRPILALDIIPGANPK